MIKFKLYIDKDKEEVFLNDMVAKGYAMNKFFMGFYSFKECKPNEYTYRVDLLSGKNYEQKSDYIQLVKEAGGEYVQRWGPWIFFRKKGDFELYTDNESQIEFYSRIKKLFIFGAILESGVAIYQLVLSIVLSHHSNKTIFIVGVFILLLFTAIFLKGIHECNKKIKSFKSEI